MSRKTEFDDLKLLLDKKFLYALKPSLKDWMEEEDTFELRLEQIGIWLVTKEALFGLIGLRKLSFLRNNIEKIDAHLFERQRALKELGMSFNKISRIDDDGLVDLGLLEKLYLSQNQLETINGRLFRELKKLEELFLGFNKISNIAEDAFANLGNLKVLYLRENQLTRIDGKWFRNLKNLERLDMGANKICDIAEDAFQSQENLKFLILDSNRLVAISTSIFNAIGSSIVCIKLGNNCFKSKILSFFNEQICPDKIESIPKKDYQEELAKGGGFTSDWNEFLKQKGFERIRIEKLERGVDINEQYRIRDFLGSGTFGQTFRLYDQLNSNDQLVLKVISKEIAKNEDYIKSIFSLKHGNLVKFFDRLELETRDSEVFMLKFCVVTEFCQQGSLASLIEQKKEEKPRVPLIEAERWMLEATNGLKYLHEKKKAHLNIKPDNIGQIKISDYGVVDIMKAIREKKIEPNIAYMSPEFLKFCCHRFGDFSLNTDVWSLGCVFYEMIYFEKAFPNGPLDNQKVLNLGSSVRFDPLLKIMLKKDAPNRIDSNKLHYKLMSGDIKEDERSSCTLS